MNNKKIGIVTVHRNVNYGANLQAFATARFLNENNFNAEIIDYLPKELDKDNYLFSWLKTSWDNGKYGSLLHKVKLFLALLLSIPYKSKKLKAFYGFRTKKCNISPKYNSLDEVIKAGYTDIVCGSDQIWNPDITVGINPLYFGDVLGIKNKISYAASMGKEKYNETDEKLAADLIKNMDCVSVREEKSVAYIEEISGKKVTHVCDPVFLLNKEIYKNIAKPIKCKKPYLLVYNVAGNKKMLNSAFELANKNGLMVVEIGQTKKRGNNHVPLAVVTPVEFLGAIMNASVIVTNSFHGTAFSLIFNKEFYVFDNKERGSRITGLLEKAGLISRINEEKIIEQENIDYSVVENNLKEHIALSKEFLLNALNAKKEPITNNCIGCGACKAVCKKDAISLIKNKKGFIKSFIDKNKCVDCGLCKKACPTENPPSKNEVIDVFAYKAKDSIRKNSTSGGAAAALAEAVIADGGVVFGASLNEDFCLNHIEIKTKKDIALMQGTKYIQSNMNDIFLKIKEALEQGKSVLFTGTPCQNAGLLNYAKLNKLNTDKLYLCDIICHGVPSPKAFADFIAWLKEREEFNEYYFRNKAFSWRGDSASIKLNKEFKRSKYISSFMNLYYTNLITDEACFNCKFTSYERVSDITVSDFWGIENTAKEFEDALGVSMVIVNTLKGKELFEKIGGKKKTVSLENAKQPQLKNPTNKPSNYSEFWQNYNIKTALNKYGAIKDNLKTKIYKLIKG